MSEENLSEEAEVAAEVANETCLPVPASMLYRRGASGRAAVLIYHLYGALDAGSSAQLAIHQILATLPSERIATFDADALLDYRARRPASKLENWVIDELEMPEIALDLVTDFSGRKLLVLHGPEPDFRWHAFGRAIAQLAAECGVEKSYDMMGMPAALPHTRASLVHETAIDANEVPIQAPQPGPIRFSASAGIYLQRVLAEQGVIAKGLLVGVPYYLAEDEYPRAAVALLQHLARTTELDLPIGDLEELATVLRAQLNAQVADNPELAALLEQLEMTFDNAQLVTQTQPAVGLTPEATDLGADLAQRFEEFLRYTDASERDEAAGSGTEASNRDEVAKEAAAQPLAEAEEEPITRPLFVPRRRLRERWKQQGNTAASATEQSLESEQNTDTEQDTTPEQTEE